MASVREIVGAAVVRAAFDKARANERQQREARRRAALARYQNRERTSRILREWETA